MFTRICIIDHAEHGIFIEDIPNDILESQYGGDEQKYIDDNYNLSNDYSWDYIVDAQYIGASGNPYDLGEKIDELRDEDEDE